MHRIVIAMKRRQRCHPARPRNHLGSSIADIGTESSWSMNEERSANPDTAIWKCLSHLAKYRRSHPEHPRTGSAVRGCFSKQKVNDNTC